MEENFIKLSSDEIKARLSELNNTYAELLIDESSPYILHKIWVDIKRIEMELETRNSISPKQ